MVSVSVITINYKEPELTKKCVQLLLKQQKISIEIIVIDNSGDLKHISYFKKNSNPKLNICTMVTNVGVVNGYNIGIKRSTGKYIFIVNNDTQIKDKRAVYKMKIFLDRHKNIAVIQPKIKSLSKPNYFEYAGAAGGFLDKLGYPFCRGRIFQTLEKDNGQYDNVVDISWASTCAFFAQKNVVVQLGLFDPLYFAYAEEVDMSLRIWHSGYRVSFFPHTEVFHKGESSWKKRRGRKTFYIHRNHLILFLKCYPLKLIIIYLPLRIALEFMSMIFYMLNKSNMHIFFVIYSHFVTFASLPVIIMNRFNNIKRIASLPVPYYDNTIVFDYFVGRKRNFSQLNKNKFINFIPFT
jgi:hypothetical protein